MAVFKICLIVERFIKQLFLLIIEYITVIYHNNILFLLIIFYLFTDYLSLEAMIN